ncbi:DUF4198 domain-containing protein [Blastopirellula retiformator]|uniref:Nickel uptake substrate-specific transmembrane region n=1 Tax=Blastopirellula retiformator TaxID=2527970 RepID=A0A5C5USW6_9BACT|nr:DUF4198 domain-containing protein [Blastopirellula retiformator]TWT29276.1 Nickel uptake substrate-specific transmembrane region [Blastopirellula retiformator]
MFRRLMLPLALLVCLPLPAFAHKVWLLPSQTVLSGAEPLVTVDAAVSNDLFYFNHFPLRLDNLVVTAPDGSKVEAENQATLRYRSVFDVPLKQEGTYRIAIANHGLFGSWEENGERRRWRGTPETFAKEVPTDAKNLQVTESVGRVETFVTNGAPTEKVFEVTGKGIELVPVTHPNDLYAGEKGTFRLLVEGKPMPGLTVEVIRGGTRYRDAQEDLQLTTNEQGEFSVEWKEPGMYWIETTHQDDKSQVSQATGRRLSYVATLEVLPQ